MVRVGTGHDIHRTLAGRPLRLGGVTIPSVFGLEGHSDADVVIHAVCDALLGAAGLGDIGDWFPNTDPQWKNIDSRRLIPPILQRLGELGWRPGNVDVTIHAERPRLAEHRAAIRGSLAACLGVEAERVNVKAATNEGLDAVGRGEAIACSAVVLIESISGH
jgi:2-C-methyl-D-erythritol 2,4-cyclodiphosphate synthase